MNTKRMLAVMSVMTALSSICLAGDFTKYVNPYIGADNGGYTFMGAAVPYGMVKLGPDCNRLTENAWS